MCGVSTIFSVYVVYKVRHERGYLEMAKDNDTVQYTFRFPIGLKTEIEQIAADEDRTLSKQLIYILRGYLKDRADKR